MALLQFLTPERIVQPRRIVGFESRKAFSTHLNQHPVARLGGEPGPPSLLHEIEEHPTTFSCDRFQRGIQLLGAVTIAGAEGFTRHAGRVHAGEQWIRGRDLAEGQGDRDLLGREIAKEVVLCPYLSLIIK